MKLQNNIIILSLFLVACSSKPNSVEALQAWDNKYEECRKIAESNEAKFPETSWFDELNREDKMSVLGYIYNYNSRACIEKEVINLESAFRNEGNSSLLEIFSVDFTSLEQLSKERMQHLDHNKVKEIINKYPEPFDLRKVANELGLY